MGNRIPFLLTPPQSPLFDLCTLSAAWNRAIEPPGYLKLYTDVCKVEEQRRGNEGWLLGLATFFVPIV